MSTVVVNMLDDLLDPLADYLTPQGARHVLDFRLDTATQERLDVLAEKANEGQLTSEEQAEHRQLVEALELLAILQAKARLALKRAAL